MEGPTVHFNHQLSLFANIKVMFLRLKLYLRSKCISNFDIYCTWNCTRDTWNSTCNKKEAKASGTAGMLEKHLFSAWYRNLKQMLGNISNSIDITRSTLFFKMENRIDWSLLQQRPQFLIKKVAVKKNNHLDRKRISELPV